ncbi:MAG: hypothetical protein BV459_02780 [Thermoplasmata archaeon M11B2D]|nr:MAG: hypothetical protein BV459_02780 [Thermoplasmata archaeon M11B2D]
MRFLLIYPPSEPFFIQKNRMFYGLSPPLGLLYIAKVLEADGDTVSILDYSAEPFDEHKLITAACAADAFGISVLTPFYQQTKQLIELIKQHNPTKPIIIGGPHCLLFPKEALRQTGAAIAVFGDGEQAILALKKRLMNKEDFQEIPGVVYQTDHGVNQGPASELIADLNSIPFPARHLVKHAVYGREYNPFLKAGEFTSIITSRGCPYRCRFCSRGSISMQQYRVRSTENILTELKEIQNQGYRHVAFVDDCFPVNTKKASDLFDAIISEHLALRFSITATRVDLADEELYKKMRQAGVAHVQFGLESGNQDVLDFYNKHTSIEAIQNAVHLSHRIGFFTIGSFILGAPFETIDHFKTTLAFAKTLPLDSVSFLPLRYMAGSDLWNRAVQEGKITKDEYVVIADKDRGLGMYSKEELLRFCISTQQSFYMRPTFFITLLKKSLKNNDMSFMHSYLSVAFSSMKKIRKSAGKIRPILS